MRMVVFFLFMISAATSVGYFLWQGPAFFRSPDSRVKETIKADDNSLLRMKQQATAAVEYVHEKGFNTQYCFLLDMRIASGRKRFFVYDLQRDSVEKAGLVAHGTGSDNGSAALFFSNKPNSNATSLGKYRIGKSYWGRFGLAYKLYGLEETNSKAFERFVVLHGHECVPEGELYPDTLCQSWGCPTVAPSFLQALKRYIDTSPKPVLLWIYY